MTWEAQELLHLSLFETISSKALNSTKLCEVKDAAIEILELIVAASSLVDRKRSEAAKRISVVGECLWVISSRGQRLTAGSEMVWEVEAESEIQRWTQQIQEL